MGANYWDFDGDSCQIRQIGVTKDPPKGAVSSINCSCAVGNDNFCHVVRIVLKGYSLPGVLPPQLAKLRYLQEIDFALNFLSGTIPAEWTSMQLTSIRINDNNFNGNIPAFITGWKQLLRFYQKSFFYSSFAPYKKFLRLHRRISNIGGPFQLFPDLSNMTSLVRLVLRSCNLSGQIPSYIWAMEMLELLDVSFNRLVGQIPSAIIWRHLKLKFIFLSGNLLSGPIPDSVLMDGNNMDLSYNNFTWPSSQQPVCQELNMNLNLFRSSAPLNNLNHEVAPCMDDFHCREYLSCLHVNCGGEDIEVGVSKGRFLYQGDGSEGGGTAKYYLNHEQYWGFSSTGDFMDDNNFQNVRYTISLQSQSPNLTEFDMTARRAPISLTYFHYCLENGNYTVTLHFAEIEFTNDRTYNSLGRRLFDIYIQDELVHKDFNIEFVSGGAQRPTTEIYNVIVRNHVLDIRLFWAGKGTTRIPKRGVYGPIISAISVESDTKDCPPSNRKGYPDRPVVVGVGVAMAAICLFFFGAVISLVAFLFRKKGHIRKILLIRLETTFTAQIHANKYLWQHLSKGSRSMGTYLTKVGELANEFGQIGLPKTTEAKRDYKCASLSTQSAAPLFGLLKARPPLRLLLDDEIIATSLLTFLESSR
ncbi:hypothetical protein SAY87_030512 [Trapa incisa]|uniref:non-specific serine/threonine protein kinase n=1 Tax=Trapa incisa TaxID=236973 RepID=A0AAN7KNL4_9MYRT|nr:hypothetical protein SAY87_030512 [Trapa incisa]